MLDTAVKGKEAGNLFFLGVQFDVTEIEVAVGVTQKTNLAECLLFAKNQAEQTLG
ncbi:hypothetical protein [Pontibacter qinzhouensis]|uniref:hypothetical protein n=1 Tax=Pontibacter qinzhouensis TaxID=2603253 RepID=UPI00164EF64E|nr:hypothetical protein [Pontibacter qinzhouensis]